MCIIFVSWVIVNNLNTVFLAEKKEKRKKGVERKIVQDTLLADPLLSTKIKTRIKKKY